MKAQQLSLASLALALTACSTSLPQPEFERFNFTRTIGPADYPDVPAVVLLDRGTLFLGSDSKTQNATGRLRRYRRVKVLRPEGVKHAEVILPFDPTTAIYGLIARTITPTGEIYPVDEDQITIVKHPTGVKAKRLILNKVAPGNVLEIVYDLYLEDLRFIPAWVFQSTIPTVRSEFAVVVPQGFQVDLRFSEKGTFINKPPERFETQEGTRFSWSMANLPARFIEEQMPHPDLLSPRAHVIFVGSKVNKVERKGFASWDQVGSWFLAKQPKWTELTKDNQAEALRVAGDSSQEEQALKLMEIVARDLPEDPGPRPPLWRAQLPHPNNVLKFQHANPTSRGLLLVSLLRAVGIPAVPGLVAYRDEDTLLPDVPTVRSLDGVVAVVPRPEAPLVLDPSQLTVHGAVPSPRIQNTRIVTLHEESTQILRVPVSTPENSVTELGYTLNLDPRGDVYGSLEARLTGAEAGGLRDLLLAAKPEEYAGIVSNYFKVRGAGLAIDSVQIADLRSLRRPLTLKGKVNLRGLITGEGEELFVSLEKFLGGPQDPLREVRRADIVLGAPRKLEINCTLTMPEDYEISFLPDAMQQQWEGEEVRFSLRQETRRRIGMSRKSVRTALTVAKRDYVKYRRYLEGVRAIESQTFAVKRPKEKVLEY